MHTVLEFLRIRIVTPLQFRKNKKHDTFSQSVLVCIPHADGTHCVLLCIVHRTRPWCARAPVRLRAWCDCAPTVVARMARVGSADSAYRCIIPLAHSRMCQLKNSESIYRIRCWCCQSFRVATHRTIRHLCMLQAFICMPRHHDPRRSSPARVSVCVCPCVCLWIAMP